MKNYLVAAFYNKLPLIYKITEYVYKPIYVLETINTHLNMAEEELEKKEKENGEI